MAKRLKTGHSQPAPEDLERCVERRAAVMRGAFPDEDEDDEELAASSLTTRDADWQPQSHDDWVELTERRELGALVDAEITLSFDRLIRELHEWMQEPLAEQFSRSVRSLKRRIRKICRGDFRAPVCPACQNVGPPVAEDRFDTSRIELLLTHVSQLTRTPEGGWALTVGDDEYGGSSLREVIDLAAQSLDMKLRPSAPVRFRAYVRRFFREAK